MQRNQSGSSAEDLCVLFSVFALHAQFVAPFPHQDGPILSWQGLDVWPHVRCPLELVNEKVCNVVTLVILQNCIVVIIKALPLFAYWRA